MVAWVNGGPTEKLFFPIIALAIIVAVVFVQEGQRRIPIQYAKRVVGRRQVAGGTTYMPLRVNMAGVIPVIFAAAVMAFFPTLGQFVPSTQSFVNKYFQPSSLTYLLLEGALIVIFTYFYTAVQFNPVDQADNLRKHGGYIPGIRPGPPTATYLDRVLTRLTLPGALYLAIIAVAPSIFIRYGGFSQANSRALGGTSVLIVVGVALDTMRQMESQMMMRHYEGFLRVMNILILGPQGSGKGTQAQRIAASYGIAHIATGDMLRDAMAAGTELGRARQADLRRGELVPDDLMIGSDPRAPRAGRRRGRVRAGRLPAHDGAGRGARRDAARDRAAGHASSSSWTCRTTCAWSGCRSARARRAGWTTRPRRSARASRCTAARRSR